MSSRQSLPPPPPSPSPPPDASDPFLVASRDIPLTQRDRQEGYDLDLVHSKPRGDAPPSTQPLASTSSPLARSSSGGSRRKPPPPLLAPAAAGYFGQPPSSSSAAAVPPSSSTRNPSYANNPSATSPLLDSSAKRSPYSGASPSANGNRLSGGAGAGLAADDLDALESRGEKYPGRTSDPDSAPAWGGAGAGGFAGGLGTAGRGKKKAWYLRPRALMALAALVIIILALSIGLGVGLTRREKTSDAVVAVQSPYGTVIPSSLGNITSTRLRTSSAKSSSSSSAAAAAASTSSVAVISTSRSSTSLAARTSTSSGLAASTASPTQGTLSDVPMSGNDTVKASTGNLPIPIESSTIIGTEVISALSTGL